MVLLAIHSDDAYAGSETEKAIPLAGTVEEELHNNSDGDCWMGGSFKGDDGSSYYFFKAAFKAE